MKHIKKKNRKKLMMQKAVISCMLITASAFLFYSSFTELKTTFELKSQIQSNLQEAAQLDEKKKELETTKENLSNPDYVEYIARGKYLVSREGEQVFKFPSIDLQKDEE